jgi:hypothetical protein
VKNRNLRHKLEVIKDRVGLTDDPDFKEMTEREYINLFKEVNNQK